MRSHLSNLLFHPQLISFYFISFHSLYYFPPQTGHTDYVGAVAAWKGPQPIVVSGSSDGTVKAWNTQDGSLIATGEGHTRDAWALGATHEPDALIVSGSFDRTLKVWDLNPVLKGLNWQRRKHFCMFLSMLGYCQQQQQKTVVVSEQKAVQEQPEQAEEVTDHQSHSVSTGSYALGGGGGGGGTAVGNLTHTAHDLTLNITSITLPGVVTHKELEYDAAQAVHSEPLLSAEQFCTQRTFCNIPLCQIIASYL